MSILFVTCECGAADGLVRQAAQAAGLQNWMSLPVHKGKEHCLTVLSHFPEGHRKLLAFRALESLIAQGGSYAVVVGYDGEQFYWSSIDSNSPKDMLDAVAILKRFA